MSTSLRHELTYDAPPEAVAAMLTDAGFREEVCEALGARRREVSVEPGGGGTVVTIDYWVPTAGIPSFARRIVGDETNVVQQEIWTGHRADVRVTIPGKPGDMSGTARLEAQGAGTREVVDLTVKVGIPLVGGKAEALIADMLASALRRENTTGRAYLSR